jgi:hypothetical protein
MRAANLSDIEASTGMTVNTHFSILSFLEEEIIDKASRFGVSMGNNGHEVAMSVNELLDSETDRAMVMLKKTMASTPTEDVDPNGLSIPAIEYLYEDLAPESIDVLESPADNPVLPTKVTRERTRKKYDLSAVRRSSGNQFKTKFHDE